MNLLFRELQRDLLKCVDVGARGGMQSHWLRYAGLIELDAFEPDEVACAEQQRANRPNEHWYPLALGRETGTAKLYVLKKASSASLFPPNPAIMDVYSHSGRGELDHVSELSTLAFSDFLEKYRRPKPNLIKLDTQGSELDILKALQDADWSDLLAVQTEIEFTESYFGRALFHELDAFMRGKGFIMFDLLPGRIYRSSAGQRHYYLKKHLNIARNRKDISARLIGGDAFYIRPPEGILASGNRLSLLKLFLILLIYRCLDEALWLAEAAAAKGVLTAAEAAELIEEVRRVAPKPSLRQRADRWGTLARRWSKQLNIGRARKIDYWMDRSWDN
jgi:FkbM family methyltransferase